MNPYYEDDLVTLYHGDCREVLPSFLDPEGLPFDCAVVDPPYGETSLAWDRWIPELPIMLTHLTHSMWMFGSMRMFLEHRRDLADWNLSQDLIWEKHNGSGFHADRFKRVHEVATHWYRGAWGDLYHDVPVTNDAKARVVRKKERPAHMGEIAGTTYVSEDGGPRLMRSVIQCRSMHGRALHPTEKPSGILEPLITYACKPGGVVLDPTAGSGSTLAAAKGLGRRAVGVEASEEYCEIAANRLAQDSLFGGVA